MKYKTTFENGETRNFTSDLPLAQLIALNVGDLRKLANIAENPRKSLAFPLNNANVFLGNQRKTQIK